MRAPMTSLGVALLAALAGCAEDACKSQPASFELEVSAAAGIARVIQSLEVEVSTGGSTWRKRYPVPTQLADGLTALGVQIEPAPSGDFALEIEVRGLDADGTTRAQARTSLQATADGCNRASLALGVATPTDGGVPDARTDAGPTDGDVDADAEPDAGLAADAEVPDADAPDSGEPLDSGIPLDTGVPADTGVPPDSGLPPDTGFAPDASGPDAGGTAFPYPPSNFDPANAGALVPRIQLNCGETVFDSTTGLFTNDCGRTMPTMVLTPQAGGVTAALLAVAGLDILPGSALRVTGSRPVIIAVFGNATIAGRLDARGSAATAGAGGGTDCAGGSGAPPASGVGGGGGGSFSTAGTSGGNGGAIGGPAGTPSGTPPLVPLRGGCGGGSGAGPTAGASGGAGGAVQLSAAGTLSVPGEVNAGGGGGSGGGTSSGGGGGGSGGGILLEGRSVVVVGTVVANGGAGGGGGGSNTAGMNGGNGATSPATGGTPGNGAGTGGNGATRTSLATSGSAGAAPAGGGGGGGGLGRVRINATMCNVGGTISPAHTGCP